MQQALHGADKARRVDFCGEPKMFLEENPAVPLCIWFSDEINFHLNGYMH
jgi:hypothetical protein